MNDGAGRWTGGPAGGVVAAVLVAACATDPGTPAVAYRLGAAGGTHACALTTHGAVYCWGLNTFGQVGDGTVETRSTPTPVAPPAS